ncbi:hypothetical protein RGI85_001974 [Serratia marcescens]
MNTEKDFLLTVHPTTEANWCNENVRTEGLLLRDYFAAKAMQAIVRRYDGHSFGGGSESPQYKELSDDAYYIADAMLKARNN